VRENMLPIALLGIDLALLSKFFKKNKLNKYFSIIAISLGILAFFFQPSPLDDLTTHYFHISNARLFGIEYFKTQGRFDGLYTYQALFIFISKLPYNNFLPAFTAFIVYYYPLKMLYKISMKFQLTKKQTLWILAFMMFSLQYTGIISGIRNMIAFSLGVYIMYIDLEEKRWRPFCFVMYFILCLLHQSTVILVAIRIITNIQKKALKRLGTSIFVFWSLFVSLMLSFMTYFTSIPYIGMLAIKLYGYTLDDDNVRNIIPNSYWLIMMVIRAFVAIFLFYVYCKTKQGKNEGVSKLHDVFIYVFAFMIGSVISYHIFIRLSNVLILLSPVILSQAFYQMNNGIIVKSKIMLWVQIISICVLIYTFFIVYKGASFGFALYQ